MYSCGFNTHVDTHAQQECRKDQMHGLDASLVQLNANTLTDWKLTLSLSLPISFHSLSIRVAIGSFSANVPSTLM